MISQLRRENAKLKELVDEQDKIKREITAFYNISPWALAWRRLPALAVTLGLELVGGIVIDQLHKVIKAYTLIVSFMPAISALSGNLGLQASSNTIRGLGTGHILKDKYGENICKEIKSGLVAASVAAIVMSLIGGTWAYLDHDNIEIIRTDPEHPFVFGGVLFVGTWISMMVSTVNGAGTPILAQLMQLDPAKIAGPLETAFQDIVGQSFLLGVSFLVFHYTENRI